MSERKTRPALTREARENQLIDLAIDQVERQLREGTASSQVLVHYLKLASTRESLEKEKIRAEIELSKAKSEAAAAEARSGELYKAAVAAMREYHGADYDDMEVVDVEELY